MLKPEMLKFGKAKKANRNAVQVRPREERSDEFQFVKPSKQPRLAGEAEGSALVTLPDSAP